MMWLQGFCGPGITLILTSLFVATSLASPPLRMVTIGPNAAEIICALGACDKIVGVDRFCVYPPELRDKPKVGGLFDPDLERIVTLKPDLVVLRGRSQAVEDLCKRLSIQVYLDQTDRLADIKTCIHDLAKMLDREQAGQTLTQEFDRKLEVIRSRVVDKPRPRVFLAVSRSPDRLADVLTAGKGTFLSEMIEVAGGVNVFGQLDVAWPQVSMEGIITARPDVIIELQPELELTEEKEAQMRHQWRALGSIPAVTRNEIHFIIDDHSLIPSPRYVEIVEKVSRLLHPE